MEKSDTEIDTYESREELKLPQKREVGGILLIDDLNGREMIDPRVQAMFKRFRHKNSPIYLFNQDYNDFPKRTTRTNGNIYHIFKPNKLRDVQVLYQDKVFMDMTINEFKLSTFNCWIEKKLFTYL